MSHEASTRRSLLHLLVDVFLARREAEKPPAHEHAAPPVNPRARRKLTAEDIHRMRHARVTGASVEAIAKAEKISEGRASRAVACIDRGPSKLPALTDAEIVLLLGLRKRLPRGES